MKKHKLHSVISVAIILAFIYPTASLLPIDLTFLTSLPSKIAAAFADKPKPQKVELTDKRTENSKTYLNPNGSYTTEISQQPINYEDNGQMKPINNTLIKDSDGYKSDENSLQVDFGDKANSLIKITNAEDNTSIGYRIADSQKHDIAPVKKADDKVIYTDYKQDTSLSYEVQNGRIKEEIILDKPPADNTFTFELDLKGLKPKPQKDGSINLLNKENKASIIIEKPFMTDSHKDAPPELFLSYNIEMVIKPKQGTIYTLVVSADRNWLEDPKRVYPVKIDPTFTVQERPIEDTLIYQAAPDTSYGGLDKLYVGGWSDTSQMKSLIKYDLSYIPKDAVVSNAKLENFIPISTDYLSNINLYDYQNATSTRLYRATAAWNGGSTWNSMANNHDSNIIAQSSVDNPGFDVTNLVKDWHSGKYPNYGVMLDNTSKITIIDDDVPGGTQSSTWPSWEWWTAQIHSGSRSHLERGKSGYHRHLYSGGAKYFIPVSSAIEGWVYPAAWKGGKPREIMLQFHTSDRIWENRAYWGENIINFGNPSVDPPSRQYIGPIPGYGSWQKLSIPWADWVGLNNKVIDGIAFSLYDGEAVFDEVYGWRKQVFHSSESADRDKAPRLAITYELKRIGKEDYKTYKDFSGASVDVHTGNLLIENTDLQIQGQCPSTTITRTYNSQDSSTGIFGVGFRSYPDSLRINFNGPSAVVDTATGAKHTYNQNVDGTYQRPPGVSEDLIKNANGTFTLKRKDMSKVDFDELGRAVKETDKNGNTLTFDYGANGRISTIIDVAGRQTTFTYNPDNTVAKITDFANRSVTYDYLNSRLAKVANPAGQAIQYEYNASGNLSTIINPLGNRTQIIYDAQGMAASITNPLGKVMSFDYKTQSVRNTDGNLISNPSFESGLVGWNRFGNLNFAVYSDPASPFGNNFMETNLITQNPGDSWYYDVPASIKAGKNYTFSIYLRSPGGTSINGTLALWGLYGVNGNQNSNTTFSTSSKEWQRISTTFTAPTDFSTFKAQIYLDNVNVNYDFDGAQLEEGTIATQYEDSSYGYKPKEASFVTVTDPNTNKYTYYLTPEGLLTKTGEPMGSTVDYPAPEPDFPLDLSIEEVINDEFDYFDDCFADWEEDFTISEDECSEVDSETEKVWDKAWEPTFAKENIPPPEISQPLKAGSVIFYEYDSNYNLTKVINKDDTFTTYSYDSKGNRTSETNHDHSVPEKTIPAAEYNNKHRTINYGYDSNNNLTWQRSATKKYSYYSYDTNGNLIREQDAEGNVTIYTYDTYGNQLTKTDPKGGVSYNYYDTNANLTRAVDPEGVSTYDTYDSLGYKLTEQKEGLAPTKYTYDVLGRQKTQENAPNNQGEYTINKSYYNADGSKAKDEVYEVKADGAQTLKSWINYTYDPAGQLIAQEDNTIAKTTYEYDANGNKVKETNPLGGITSYEYDALNRLTKEAQPDGNFAAYKYDSFGNVVKEGTPDGTSVNVYDKGGNEIASASPDGSVTKTLYDKEGNEATTGDGKNNVAASNYDANGNIEKVVDSKANETKYQYDANQNEKAVISPTTPTLTNPSGTVATSTDFNAANQVKTETDQNGAQTNTGYNTSGQESTIQPPTNQDQAITYDNAGNATAVNATTNQANSADVKSTYDASGNPTEVKTTDAIGGQTESKVNTTYDTSGKVTSITDFIGNTINFDYDLAGNLTKLSDSSGAVSYVYDTASKLKSVTDPNNKTTSFNYSLSGNLTNTTLPNGVTTDTNYDAASKVTNLTNKQGEDLLSSHNYTYDANGNITSTNEISNVYKPSFEDKFESLASVQANSGTVSGSAIAMDRYKQRALKDATAINYAYNPSFEVDTSNWTSWASQGGYSIQKVSGGVFGASAANLTGGAVNSHFWPKGDKLTQNGDGTSAASIGELWTGSVYLKTNVNQTSGKLWLVFMNQAGSWIGSKSTSYTTTTEWQRITISDFAPVGTYSVKVNIEVPAQTSILADGVQLEQNPTVSTYIDGSLGSDYGWFGSAHASNSAYWKPNSTFYQGPVVEKETINYVYNPSFEDNPYNWNRWSPSGGESIQKVSSGIFGSSAAKLTAGIESAHFGAKGGGQSDNGDGTMTASFGQTWTASAYIKSDTADVSANLWLVYLNQAGNWIWYKATPFKTNSEWQRVSVSDIVPIGAYAVKLNVQVPQSSSILIDGVQLEKTLSATSYADGSLGAGYSWWGTANAAKSVRESAILTVPTTNIDVQKGTIGIWAYVNDKLRDTGEYRYIFSTDTNNGSSPYNNMLALRHSGNNRWTFRTADELGNGSFTEAPDDGSLKDGWHHFAVSWDKASTTAKLYIDGKLKAENNNAKLPSVLDSKLRLGYLNWDVNYGYINSAVDNLQIYNKVFSEDLVYKVLYDPKGEQAISYTYDSLNRLTKVTNPDASTVDYTYDEQGNRLTKTESSVDGQRTTNYTYSPANELRSTTFNDQPSTTYTYDENGNTTEVKGPESGVWSYIYDNKNQLVKVTKPNGDTVEYTYDGNGNRYKKSVITRSPEGDVVISDRYYSYDTAGNIVSEYKKTDTGTETLVKYIRDNSGKAISMIQGSNTYYFTYNGHGDVTALTDSSGAIVATYSYDEFGNQTSSTGKTYNPLRYSGANNAYYDTETGLYKMGARYYQPDVGRWLTRDGFKGLQEQPATMNKYIYVRNNPINKIDPTGYWDADKHHYGWTKDIAKKYFSLDYAKAIAEGSRAMDNATNNALVYPQYHFDFSGSLGRRKDACLKTALNWWGKSNKAKAADWLGRGLHSVQDRYAHPKEIKGYDDHGNEFLMYLTHKWTIMGWIRKYETTYDNPDWRPKRAEKAKKATEKYIITFVLNI